MLAFQNNNSITNLIKGKIMLRNFKVLLTVLIILVIAGGAYAFAAQNTVPDSAAGYKANVVAGYTVSNIVYDLNEDNPTLIDKITFDIVPNDPSLATEAATVKIQTADLGPWTDCTLGTATAHSKPVTCTYGALQVLDVNALNIVASSSLDPAP